MRRWGSRCEAPAWAALVVIVLAIVAVAQTVPPSAYDEGAPYPAPRYTTRFLPQQPCNATLTHA